MSYHPHLVTQACIHTSTSTFIPTCVFVADAIFGIPAPRQQRHDLISRQEAGRGGRGDDYPRDLSGMEEKLVRHTEGDLRAEAEKISSGHCA